jgi:arsenate reductase-like glutaredoxin family protein
MAKCKNCVYFYRAITSDNEYICNWCEKIKDNPHEDIERECEYYESLTNADRIRSMTDEELAEFLFSDDYYIDCTTCKERENEYGTCIGKCENELLRWLKSEVG